LKEYSYGGTCNQYSHSCKRQMRERIYESLQPVMHHDYRQLKTVDEIFADKLFSEVFDLGPLIQP